MLHQNQERKKSCFIKIKHEKNRASSKYTIEIRLHKNQAQKLMLYQNRAQKNS